MRRRQDSNLRGIAPVRFPSVCRSRWATPPVNIDYIIFSARSGVIMSVCRCVTKRFLQYLYPLFFGLPQDPFPNYCSWKHLHLWQQVTDLFWHRSSFFLFFSVRKNLKNTYGNCCRWAYSMLATFCSTTWDFH